MKNTLAHGYFNEAALEIIKILKLDHTRINFLRLTFNPEEFIIVRADFYVEEDDLKKIATELKKYEIVDKTEDSEQFTEEVENTVTVDDPQSGEWYWVRIHDSDAECEWTPAVYDPSRAGGWTNGDTWEDFDEDVISWVKIPLPSEIKEG